MEIKRFIRDYGAVDIVAHLELKLIRKSEKIVLIPLGPEIKELRHKELEELASKLYSEECKLEAASGFSYRIIEKD